MFTFVFFLCSLVRRSVEERYRAWLDAHFAALSRGGAGGDEEGDAAPDSMGLAALAGGGGGRRLAPGEVAGDSVLQHVKVVLLLAVLLRHLQARDDHPSPKRAHSLTHPNALHLLLTTVHPPTIRSASRSRRATHGSACRSCARPPAR